MKWAKNANIWPKMTKNAYLGPILAVFGPKILIFMGVSKSFGTNITENHFGNLSALFFGQALDQMGQKCRYLAQNASAAVSWRSSVSKVGWKGAPGSCIPPPSHHTHKKYIPLPGDGHLYCVCTVSPTTRIAKPLVIFKCSEL